MEVFPPPMVRAGAGGGAEVIMVGWNTFFARI